MVTTVVDRAERCKRGSFLATQTALEDGSPFKPDSPSRGGRGPSCPRPSPLLYAISNAPQLAEVNPANVQSFALVRLTPSETIPVM